MPAVSTAQRRAMAIAEHHPSELFARNRGLKEMAHEQLHEFASTREKGLPRKKGKVHAMLSDGGSQPMIMIL